MKKRSYNRVTDKQASVILKLAEAGKTNREIADVLAEDSPDGEGPDQSTVGRIRRKAPPNDLAVPWREGWPTDPEGADFLFNCLFVDRFLLAEIYSPFTSREVKWLLRLRTIFDPKLCEPLKGQEEWQVTVNALGTCLAMASNYADEERISEILQRPMKTAPYDDFLLLRPWQNESNRRMYRELVKAGVLRPLPDNEELLGREKALNPEYDVEAGRRFLQAFSHEPKEATREVRSNERQPTAAEQGKLDAQGRATTRGRRQAPPVIRDVPG